MGHMKAKKAYKLSAEGRAAIIAAAKRRAAKKRVAVTGPTPLASGPKKEYAIPLAAVPGGKPKGKPTRKVTVVSRVELELAHRTLRDVIKERDALRALVTIYLNEKGTKQ